MTEKQINDINYVIRGNLYNASSQLHNSWILAFSVVEDQEVSDKLQTAMKTLLEVLDIYEQRSKED